MRELDIELQFSKLFGAFLIGITFGSILVTGYSSLNLAYKCLLSLMVILYSSLIFIQRLSFGRKVTRIVANENGWQMGKGYRLKSVKILGESTLSRWVCIIRYKASGEFFKHTCLVFKDAVDPPTYRRLRVALRYWRV